MSSAAIRFAPSNTERRSFQRVRIKIYGRFMLEDRTEHPCQVVDMSPGNAALRCEKSGEPGEKVIAYLDHIGRVEGVVTRRLQDGFAMTIVASERKKDKLAAQLTWLANKHELDLPEDRRHERIAPRAGPSASSATGAFSSGRNGTVEGPSVCHPFGSLGAIWSPPFHGTSHDAFRPACDNWIAIGMSDQRRTLSITPAIAASVASSYSPTSPCVIRPSGSTALASIVSSAAPDSASCPRWIWCQSFMQPLFAEYWHIGAMTIRLASVRLPTWSGSNSFGPLMRRSIGWWKACACPLIYEKVRRNSLLLAEHRNGRAGFTARNAAPR